jgi:hypothetical protein
MMKRTLTTLATLLWLTTPGLAEPPVPAPAAGEAKPLDIEDPAQCAGCHETIVQEWQASMHANAHHSKDPVYAAMRTLRMAKQGAAVAEGCANCHTPRAPSPDFEGVAATGGVTCASCHNVKTVHAKGVGAKRTTRFAGNTLVGPHEPRKMDAPHGLGATPKHFKDGFTLCLTCHEQAKAPSGVTLCNTGTEFGDQNGAFPEQRCVDCHMPIVSTPSGSVDRDQAHASHMWATAHHHWNWPEHRELAPVPVELTAVFVGSQLHVQISNETGHSYPTGFPGRMAILKLVGQDAAGKAIWTNFESAPMKASPQSVFNSVYGDADGKPTLPPLATQLLRDNRLRPGETRTLRYGIPRDVQTINAVLLYRLLPPPAAKAFGLTDAPEGKPRPILKASFTRP